MMQKLSLRLRKCRGLNLIELMLSSVIFIVLGGALAIMFSGITSAFSTITAQTTAQMRLGATTRQFIIDVEQSVDAPASYMTYTRDALGGDADSADPDAAWILRVPSINSSGNVLNAESLFDYLVYSYDPTTRQLSRVIASANAASARSSENPSRVIANDITSIAFVPPSGLTEADSYTGVVDLRLTATRTEQRIRYPNSLTGRAVYRNAAL